MRAMRLHNNAPIESSPLTLDDIPDRAPARGEVRIRVGCCAICRTDLHVIEGELPPVKLPLIPGHQIVGRIDAMGEGVSGLRIGQRVGIAWLRETCGRCRFCTSGRENLCESARFTGYHEDGGYADLAVARADFVYELPELFDDVRVSPLLCAGIIGYRALKRSNLKRGGKLAIFGFGSSAHIVLQLARGRGCEVFVISRAPQHQEFARDLGAAWTGTDVSKMPAKMDAAIIFAPAGEIVPAALGCLDRGGTVALAGIHMSPIPPLDYDRLLQNERDIHPVTANTRADARELLAEAARVPVHVNTTSYRLEDANRALQDLKADRINGTGVLIVDE